LVWFARRSSVALSVPIPLIASLAAVSIAMCAAGSLISIRRVLRLDPATVLR
jgi:ABC-type antimicrobial peptide transport system permease subunit